MTAVGDREIDVVALLARLNARPKGITSDSRAVTPGLAFAAYPGRARDGRQFIADAVDRGADAVLWEAEGFKWDPALSTPNHGVDGLRQKLGPIADFIYGSPSKSLWMVGVTGTNGKTTCTQWIAQALIEGGRRAAVLGTLGNGFPGELESAPNTTPDAALLQQTLARMKAKGADVVAMEVSSIGLEQGRVNGVDFDVALFTNLSRDHLDYHGTMAAYGAEKAKLFGWSTLSTVVINTDDDFGKSLADRIRGRRARTLTYGMAGAEISVGTLAHTASGLALGIHTPWGPGQFETAVVGSFNVMNLLGTLGVLLASDVTLADAVTRMAKLEPPAGRMERFGGGRKPLVIVDYAHTPDALGQVLNAMRSRVANGASLVCLFGAGGDRDPGKRPEMGRVAASLADRVIVTSDNPRSEDPTAIAMAVAQGVIAAGNRHWILEIDRAKAIAKTIAGAQAGDVIVIAGKGHEPYQEAAGVRTPFSDAAHAKAALAARGGE
ncbi:MAG TPA: UDP-N-acetylmuramoyl-L-alanyl-D-glutamate--2,6-diaminopimelate ligase [Casimicrobiaceae bacterium]|nr:UDP-N-acetylmuramoyl-L-alanyl-D-glutamate--2,6-diaminopimelate ligase [Casimicrobiaceae bacterium]